MPRNNVKGRSTGLLGQFVALPANMTSSAAWKSLTCQERCVYIVLAGLYNGKNNGWLGLGVRRAADLANVNKDTAGKALHVLEERGFIEMAAADQYIRLPGEGGLRRATEWRLTLWKCDRTGAKPSKAFTKWTDQKTKPCPSVSDRTSPKAGQAPPDSIVSVPAFRTERAA